MVVELFDLNIEFMDEKIVFLIVDFTENGSMLSKASPYPTKLLATDELVELEYVSSSKTFILPIKGDSTIWIANCKIDSSTILWKTVNQNPTENILIT